MDERIKDGIRGRGAATGTAGFSAEDLAAWSGGEWENGVPGEVRGIEQDTRTLTPGSVYIALKGEKHDGHAFVGQAFERRAAGAIVMASAKIARGAGALLRVKDPAQALVDIASRYREKLPGVIVGVTGSAGKTTVKEMIADILAEHASVFRSPGNWNNVIGLPLSILRMSVQHSFGVFELGTNHPGEMAVLAGILRPDCGVITNIGLAHIGFFGSVSEIAREKCVLLTNLSANGCAVLNRDSAQFHLLEQAAPERRAYVSVQGKADYYCSAGNSARNEVDVHEMMSGEHRVVPVPDPGAYNVANVVMAVAVARNLGINWADIQAGLRGHEGLRMRWERSSIGGVDFINDAYNANPTSMEASIGAFVSQPSAGRRWVVLGGMLELGDQEASRHIDLGRYIATLADHWYAFVGVGKTSALIARGAAEAGVGADRLFTCRTCSEAARLLAKNVEAGDVVFLKASRGIGLEEVITEFRALEER